MISEIWDYLMRRKPLLGLLAVLLALGGVIGAKVMMEHQPVVSQAQEIGVGSKPVYNNSLTFQVLGKSSRPAYELVLASDFRSAKITVTEEALDAEAYVRILNPSGQVSTSEQTTSENGEIKFVSAPRTYSVQLGRGYAIEVHGADVQVLSNLTHSPATSFMSSSTTERYVLTLDGIRKSTWSDADGKTALYNILKNYVVGQIEAYRAQLSDEVLNNRHLDVSAKAQIVLAYYNLRGVDQKPYREFINNLRYGGVPKITYSGKYEYAVGESVDFAQLVSARDGEDGEYDLSQIAIQSDVDFSQAGKYTLAYKVSDSDQNTVTLKIPITVAEVKIDEAPKPVENPASDATSSETPSTANGQVPTVGGGVNVEQEPTKTDLDNGTVWNEHGDEIEEMIDIGNTDTQLTEVQSPSTIQANESKEQEAEAHGISASQIVLLILGIVALFGLVRFIFDHYVR